MKRNHRPASPAILGKGAAHADKRPAPGELELNEGLAEYDELPETGMPDVVDYDEFRTRREQALQARAIGRILNPDNFEDID